MASSVMKEKSFLLATRIIKLYKYLVEEKREYVIAKQVLRSGTSVGANVREAQNAQSVKDFIHKLAIAQKECDETLYWLELLENAEFLSTEEFESIHKQCNEVMKIITSALMTSKKKWQDSFKLDAKSSLLKFKNRVCEPTGKYNLY